MRSLLPLSFGLSVFCCVSLQAFAVDAPPAPVEIVQQEQHLWTTFAEGDFNDVRSLYTHDYIQVGDHIQALDATLIFLKHCKPTSYELRDLQVRILTPDSAMTAYRVVSSFSCDDAAEADHTAIKNLDSNATTVWVRQPGSSRWLVQAHTETPVAKQ